LSGAENANMITKSKALFGWTEKRNEKLLTLSLQFVCYSEGNYY